MGEHNKFEKQLRNKRQCEASMDASPGAAISIKHYTYVRHTVTEYNVHDNPF